MNTFLRKMLSLFTFSVYLLIAPQAAIAEGQSVLIVGSSTVENAILAPSLQAIRVATGVSVRLRCEGTGPGLLETAKGKAAGSGASESLDESIESAKKLAARLQVEFTPATNLVFSELDRENVVFVVNDANSAISGLSKDQLRAIYLQQATNWKAFGGIDAPISVVTSRPGSATRALVQKQILNGAEYPSGSLTNGARVIRAETTALELDAVVKDRTAIAAVSESLALATKGVRIVKAPTIERPLGLITVGAPSGDIKKVIDYLRSPEGRKVWGRN